jgi:hypothetical protein
VIGDVNKWIMFLNAGSDNLVQNGYVSAIAHFGGFLINSKPPVHLDAL